MFLAIPEIYSVLEFTNFFLFAGVICLVVGVIAFVVRMRRKDEEDSPMRIRLSSVINLLIVAAVCITIPTALFLHGYPWLTATVVADRESVEVPQLQQAILKWAIQNDRPGTVRYLLEDNPYLVHTNWYSGGESRALLRLAVESRSERVVKYILEEQFDSYNNFDLWLEYDSIHCAIHTLPYQNGTEVYEILHLLMDYGADVNLHDPWASSDKEPVDTPLHDLVRYFLADHYASEEEVQLLRRFRRKGVDLEAVGADSLKPYDLFRQIVSREFSFKEMSQSFAIGELLLTYHRKISPEKQHQEEIKCPL